MTKNRLLILMTCFSALLLTACLKDAKDTLEDIEQRTRCVELLSEFTTNGGDKTCDQQISI